MRSIATLPFVLLFSLSGLCRAQAAAQNERLDRLEKTLEQLGQRIESADETDYDYSEQEEGNDLSKPLLTLQGFAHVGFNSSSRSPSTGVRTDDSAFVVGGLDLFITSQLTESISFLNETVFEPTDGGEYVLDVERLIIKYEFNDSVNLQVGRFHTSLGYWNANFHHGEYLMTTIGRPEILNFEDDGGMLPVHLIGLHLEGMMETELAVLTGHLELGNGRGAVPDPPQIIVDANGMKALNLRGEAEVLGVEGLQLGLGGYFDNIPENKDPSLGSVHSSMRETIISANVVYTSEDWEFLGEYYYVSHKSATATANSNGWYAQVGYRVSDWTPYFRVEGVSIDDADTFYASTDDTTKFLFGARWDFASFNALKAQISYSDIEAPSGLNTDLWQFRLQWAFAF